MKVSVLVGEDWHSPKSIVGVFSSASEANEYGNGGLAPAYESYSIEEFEVDRPR